MGKKSHKQATNGFTMTAWELGWTWELTVFHILIPNMFTVLGNKLGNKTPYDVLYTIRTFKTAIWFFLERKLVKIARERPERIRFGGSIWWKKPHLIPSLQFPASSDNFDSVQKHSSISRATNSVDHSYTYMLCRQCLLANMCTFTCQHYLNWSSPISNRLMLVQMCKLHMNSTYEARFMGTGYFWFVNFLPVVSLTCIMVETYFTGWPQTFRVSISDCILSCSAATCGRDRHTNKCTHTHTGTHG